MVTKSLIKRLHLYHHPPHPHHYHLIIRIFVECTLMVVESLTRKTPPSFSLWRILVASARDKEPWYHLDHLII